MNKLTEEENDRLQTELKEIGSFLPERKMGYIWNTYRKVTGSTERQPCNCKSSAKHWVKAVTKLNEYVKKLNE